MATPCAEKRDAPSVAEWPLVGREAELKELGRKVRDGDVGGLVLAGPAGVGKTRLAAELLQLAAGAGFATLRVTATRAAADLPLGVIAPLLPAMTPLGGAVDDRSDLLRRAGVALAELAGRRRLVLMVDDAHNLDEMSALFVHQVVLTRAAFVVMTVRVGVPAPEPVIGTWKDGLAERVVVKHLSRRGLEALIATAVGGPVDPAAVAELASHSRGNVLFLRELVMGATEDGSFVDDGGLWRLRASLSPSDRLTELVESRLAGLDQGERALLELLAFGEPLGPAELSALADADVAESLESRRLLSIRQRGRRLEARLDHPIYGDVLRKQIPGLRARAIVRSLAEVVEATGARRKEDTLRVASWRLLGGGASPETMLVGAREARWRYDFALAERLARSAIEAGAGFEAQLLAAELASLQGRRGQAEYELGELARVADDDASRARVALLRVDNSVLWAGRHEVDILDEAERTVVDPGWRDELAAKRLALIAVEQGPGPAVEAARGLMERAQGSALVVAGITAVWALARHGCIDAALRESSRTQAAHLAMTTPTSWYPWYHDATRAFALAYAGRFEAAEILALAHHQKALTDRSREAQAMFAVILAATVAERGQVRTAIRRAREAVALNEELGRPLMVRLATTYLVSALALAGRPDEASAVGGALEAPEVPLRYFNMLDALQARAWTAAAAGRVADAQAQLTEAAALGEEMGDLVGASVALHGIARLGQPAAVRDRLVALAAAIDGELAPARAAHVVALAERDGEGLERVSQRFEAMGADLLAAEAAVDAAVVFRTTGARRQATAAQRRATVLIERCEGPATPSLQAVEARALLTRAERETAVDAAHGLSNREIAQKLHLSVRTVENRLQRVYTKLGITGRGQLHDALTSIDGLRR